MSATITRTPRTEHIMRVNECVNPNFEAGGDITYPALPVGWDYIGFGIGGAGSRYVGGPSSYATVGARSMIMVWSTAPTGSYQENAGFVYTHPGWVAGATKTVSAYLFSNLALSVEMVTNYYSASSALISTDRSVAFTLTPGAKTRISSVITAPAGTASTKVYFCLINASIAPTVSTVLAIDCVLIEPGNVLGTYFDGDTAAAGSGTTRTVWDGTAGASRSLFLDFDTENVMTPQLVEGWDQSRPTRNTVFEFLDGTTGVVQSPAVRPRTGTLKLIFGGPDILPSAARLAADQAETQHKQGLLFALNNTDLGPLGAMTYFVVGDVVGPYPTDSRYEWRLDVPFRELS